MTAIIIEDEKPAARRLNRMLEKLQVDVVEILHSVEDSKKWFQENTHPQVVFLDIQLSDGLSFEIFETVEVKSSIIFTTAYDEYALQAFKHNSIDYLLKPIDDEELKRAVEKYQNIRKNYTGENTQPVQLYLDDIKKLLINPLDREYKKRFTVKVGQHLKMIPIGEICCFYSENKGTYILTSEGRNYLMETTLDQLENELPPETFFRVNRKFYINVNSIRDIISYTNSRLKIKLHHATDEEIIVARERVRDFKQWLE
ncbi:LytR/AlgR family response regulator transcription factor [Gillisia limnaea]|uniref:Two component transcriptional regulator, LytTR family n=1 Tax=Gillisia limnaea (strain DSM 15749 / LMG 21470 / R-8282) TaxID=865937 RepID=H2BTZ7_GILLR|nr:LytTR family DNA-binding domain-containing protein [Gillisia limnaea]EHQ03811.1 two component transcriptional regulator, LytTR family [Gillisia limnaea DSM 15749]